MKRISGMTGFLKVISDLKKCEENEEDEDEDDHEDDEDDAVRRYYYMYGYLDSCFN